MAKIIEKDILDLTKNDLKYGKSVLLQQVNCQNKMDAGVAMAIDKLARKLFDVSTIDEYHKLWDSFFDNGNSDQIKQVKELYDTTDLPLYAIWGTFVFSFSQWNCGPDGKHYTNDQRLVNNIKTVCKIPALELKASYERVYIPYKIGCGLGGGNWDYIYNQIKDIPNLIIVKRKEDK